jgi:hypothetical protein
MPGPHRWAVRHGQLSEQSRVHSAQPRPPRRRRARRVRTRSGRSVRRSIVRESSDGVVRSSDLRLIAANSYDSLLRLGHAIGPRCGVARDHFCASALFTSSDPLDRPWHAPPNSLRGRTHPRHQSLRSCKVRVTSRRRGRPSRQLPLKWPRHHPPTGTSNVTQPGQQRPSTSPSRAAARSGSALAIQSAPLIPRFLSRSLQRPRPSTSVLVGTEECRDRGPRSSGDRASVS